MAAAPPSNIPACTTRVQGAGNVITEIGKNKE
jgi:hypothetical protein